MTTMPGRDPKLALDSADSFRSLAGRFVSSIRMHVNYAWQDALADLGGLVASATNLTLAVEIYLKTLYILLGLQVPHTHNLAAPILWTTEGGPGSTDPRLRRSRMPFS